MNNLQNENQLFWRQNPVVPVRGAGSAPLQSWERWQGSCQPWDGLWGSKAGARSLLSTPQGEVTSAPPRNKCSSARAEAAPPGGFGRKGFSAQCLFLEGISSTGSQDLFQKKDAKSAGGKIKTHLLSL